MILPVAVEYVTQFATNEGRRMDRPNVIFLKRHIFIIDLGIIINIVTVIIKYCKLDSSVLNVNIRNCSPSPDIGICCCVVVFFSEFLSFVDCSFPSFFLCCSHNVSVYVDYNSKICDKYVSFKENYIRSIHSTALIRCKLCHIFNCDR